MRTSLTPTLLAASITGCSATARSFDHSTSHEPSRFTELAFVDPAGLPTRTPATGSTVSFTITNHEGTRTDYRFRVVAAEATDATGATAEVVAASKVAVADGATATEQVTFRPARTGATYLVTVELVGRDEAIRFVTAA